ncbi:MAG: alanine--tRNA ligase [Clostridia bacterium]|nr:alanine--tRNA ligase [Clostridia bacterium]
MKWTGLNELREAFLSFYESKEHLRHKSFPLVPINDKSLLLINAGMAPLKKYFTGEQEPPRHRMTTCQKCIRTPDIERVGLTARHGTYFEMLGNFSFGDYFKTEAIHWAWEFVTTVLELPKEKLWTTIYENDDEAFKIWNEEIGMPKEHIVRLGKDDNFWEIGSGPCGPCSEIYFDRGEEYGCGSPDCKPGCDCDRYMEFWNLVFTQFDGDGNGNYTPLDHPNIDTGMGLERLACLMQGVNNLFEVDTVQNIMSAVSAKAKVKYGDSEKTDISLRIITDHIRSTTFLVGDGVVPTNEGRGYVLRRLLRRAARHGRLLGIKGPFLYEIADVVAKENISEYEELTEKLDYIKKVIRTEEERFAQTIDQGMEILSEVIEKTKADGKSVIPGEAIFKLGDTYGFPIDLTREIAQENALTLDEEGFNTLLTEQKERARNARAKLGDFGWTGESFDFIEGLAVTEFTGYTENQSSACVIGLFNAETTEAVDNATEGKVIVVLDKTPFYGEGGGQVGDTGIIATDNASLKVLDTKKHDGVFMHVCEIESGMISKNDTVRAEIDVERRNAIRRNHTSAHLLQAALRRVLGNHVEQAGSYVDEKRLRFDFSHFTAVTPEELALVEKSVNDEILLGEAVDTIETDIDTAKAMGAMALFGEKYGKTVRMVKAGDYSTELCGGTHLDNTAKAGLFKIISESSVAAGVRRIEATTGFGVLEFLAEKDTLIAETASELKVANPVDMPKRALALQTELKNEKHEIEALNAKIAAAKASELLSGGKKIGELTLITDKTSAMPLDVVRTMCDNAKANDDNIIIVLATDCDGKQNLVCVCGKNAVKSGANAGKIAKQASAVTGGNGGGRPDSAVSGIKDSSLVDKALEAVYGIVCDMIK